MDSKAGSVGEWRDRKLDGRPLLETVTMNTALLLSPAEGLVVEAQDQGESLKVGFRFKGAEPSGHGAAVPITRDGYFLTASHCLEGPRSALIIFDESRGRMRVINTPWRTVWRSPNKYRLDLAVIHAPVRLARAFTFVGSRGLEVDDEVGIAGWSGFLNGSPLASQAAGKVRRISKPSGRPPEAVWQVVGHDGPMHPGDSGGPLVDRRGRLIGIHSLIRVSRIGALINPGSIDKVGYEGEAVVPDAAWLTGVIEADRASRR